MLCLVCDLFVLFFCFSSRRRRLSLIADIANKTSLELYKTNWSHSPASSSRWWFCWWPNQLISPPPPPPPPASHPPILHTGWYQRSRVGSLVWWYSIYLQIHFCMDLIDGRTTRAEPRDKKTDWWILIDVDIACVAKPFKVEQAAVINDNIQYPSGAIQPSQRSPKNLH